MYTQCETDNFKEVPLNEFYEWACKQADKDQNTYHEVIRGERFRPYFDFEVDFDAEEDMKKNHYACLREAEMEIIRAFRKRGEVLLLDSSGYSPSKDKWRVSGRFFLKGAGYFRKLKGLKKIVEKFNTKGFDAGVYYLGKTMRMAYCHKEGDKRVLQRATLDNKKVIIIPLAGVDALTDTWKDWMVGDYFSTEKKCLDPADDDSDSEDEETQTEYTRKPMSLDMIKGYVSALSEERATSRNSRRIVIMAIRQLADYQKIDLRQLALDFAMGAGDNYDEVKVEDLYENPGKHKFTFNIVIGWARKDTPDIEAKMNPPPPEDLKTFYDEKHQLLAKQPSEEDVRTWMLGCLAFIQDSERWFVRFTTGWQVLPGKSAQPFPFATASSSSSIKVPGPKGKPVTKTFKEILTELKEDPLFDRCRFSTEKFLPYFKEKPKGKVFNTFNGWMHSFRGAEEDADVKRVAPTKAQAPASLLRSTSSWLSVGPALEHPATAR
jgi:hypothetical protein